RDRLRRRRSGRAGGARRAPALPCDRRDRPGLPPRLGPGERSGARVQRADLARARHGQAARDPRARGRPGDARPARRRGRRRRRARDPALLLDAGPARRVRRARVLDLVRRQRHLPAERRAARGRRARARRADPGGDRCAVPDPAGGAQGAQPAGARRADGRGGRGGAERILRGAGGAGRAQRRRAVRVVNPTPPTHRESAPAGTGLPAQPSLRRLRAFGVRPKRDLGQNFLIDSNILDVIARAADVDAGDVVLEIGGGLGVLSEHLAERVAHVHVVEVDRSLERALRDALDPFGARATLWLADAMALDLGALDPKPTKVVANLPYGIAAGAILRTVEELPSVTRWVAMVQKEVGERLAARAGTSAYGVPSVLAQLACEVRVLRPISRQVFFPVPNVDSVLVGLERRAPAAPPPLRAFVQGAFAHRRKALARSAALAGVADRDAVRAA